MATLTTFIHGATAMGCAIAALFFLRFWRQSLDAFFLLFAIAFAILALDYVVLGAVSYATEWGVGVFLLRLLAFVVILVAIAVKNRR